VTSEPPNISVVISTFERPEACERALTSVLGQTVPAAEILICDDGSTDGTRERFERWSEREDRIQYLRLPSNTGTPAAARNAGVARAKGSWIAFLDDDDEWLPGKLAAQLESIAAGEVDLVATNALRSDGSLYFPGPATTHRPGRRELLSTNPLITSSVLVRRELIHFPTAGWLRGIEDYAAWLEAADRGARFLVLAESLVLYADAADERLSAASSARELAVARLMWTRAASQPYELLKLRSALRRSIGVLHIGIANGLARARRRKSRVGRDV
jgi:glycosyltransferase involved in cell wall biosynthesis